MQPFPFTIDLHCHPGMRAYGRSFRTAVPGAGVPSPKTNSDSSLWCYDPPTDADKVLNHLTHLTRFSQANLTAAAYGRVHLLAACLYPQEQGFFVNNLGAGITSSLTTNLVTRFGLDRIKHIQTHRDYFFDLEREYNFYLALAGQTVTLHSEKYTYSIVDSFGEVMALADPANAAKTIGLFFSIEGMHVLNCGLKTRATDPAEVLANVARVKQWAHVPWFVSLAHHFYNDLCGHARSLQGIVAKEIDQKPGLDTGFTPLGIQVMESLLDTGNGVRIPIDIKHMSGEARKFYMKEWLPANDSSRTIPIIASHGACTGSFSFDEQHYDIGDTGFLMRTDDINFFDEEIAEIARTRGIIGLQLDERRIGSAAAIAKVANMVFASLDSRLHARSKLLWNQIQHIAEVLNKRGLFAWGIQALGTDYDGIIDPLNLFWTEEEMPTLRQFVQRHAFNYMNDRGGKLEPMNRLEPEEIVGRVFSLNALDLLSRLRP